MVAASLVAAPGPDGLLGAFLGALMLAIAATDTRPLHHSERTDRRRRGAGAAARRDGRPGGRLGGGLLWAAGRALAIALPFLALMAVYRWWRGRDGLGLGDIKLAAVAGAWLGLVTVFAVVELATLSALGAYFLTRRSGGVRSRRRRSCRSDCSWRRRSGSAG